MSLRASTFGFGLKRQYAFVYYSGASLIAWLEDIRNFSTQYLATAHSTSTDLLTTQSSHHIPHSSTAMIAPPRMRPFITACISCERAVYLTKSPLFTRTNLGLHQLNTDTFIPTTCYECEQDANMIYNRLTQSAATITHDWPAFVSTKMLSTWWLYQACKERYGVRFDAAEGKRSMLVVRIRDFWRKVLQGNATAELVEFEDGKAVRENNDWRMDTFFGQPSDA